VKLKINGKIVALKTHADHLKLSIVSNGVNLLFNGMQLYNGWTDASGFWKQWGCLAVAGVTGLLAVQGNTFLITGEMLEGLRNALYEFEKYETDLKELSKKSGDIRKWLDRLDGVEEDDSE